MPSAGLEPATPATRRPQTYALDRAVTGIGKLAVDACNICWDTSKYTVKFKLSLHSQKQTIHCIILLRVSDGNLRPEF
jgi:hypothetical protein